MAVPKICGIETEYGIVVRGAAESNPISASSMLINAYLSSLAAARGAAPRVDWDFEDESPGNDARGDSLRLSMAPEIETHLVNAVLTNGARYYVDHAHPEFSAPECRDALQAQLYDRAGEEILLRSMDAARSVLPEGQEIVVYKNNSDGKGNSYGCHENYLLDRATPFGRIVAHATAHLVSRQIFTGSGKVGSELPGSRSDEVAFQLTQRADFFEEEVGLETTLKRPIINTRDEPHADAESYRRLHVIVGDSNMSEYATFLKVGAASLILRMLEDPSVVLRDMTLENPIRAIREISHDITCQRRVRLANGREASALEIQAEYLNRALRYAENHDLLPQEKQALGMWEHVMAGLERDPLSLDREIDWVTKHNLIEAYRERHDLPLNHPKVSLLDLQYHDISRERSVFYKLQRAGRVERIVSDAAIAEAMETPPQTTRARLRGEFIRRAKERKRDYTVDWVHLKLNDQAQRTVLCKDPFKATDERVERLIASL